MLFSFNNYEYFSHFAFKQRLLFWLCVRKKGTSVSILFWRQYMTLLLGFHSNRLVSHGVCVCFFRCTWQRYQIIGDYENYWNWEFEENKSFISFTKKICIWITKNMHHFFEHFPWCWYSNKRKKGRPGKGCAQEFEHFGMLSHANVSVQSNQSPPTYKFFMHFVHWLWLLNYPEWEIFPPCFLCVRMWLQFIRARIIVNEWIISPLEFILLMLEMFPVNQMGWCWAHHFGIRIEALIRHLVRFGVYALKCAISKLTSLDIKDTIII